MIDDAQFKYISLESVAMLCSRRAASLWFDKSTVLNIVSYAKERGIPVSTDFDNFHASIINAKADDIYKTFWSISS